jgi:hypothetical protein
MADHRLFDEIYGGRGSDVRLSEHEALILRGGKTRRVKLARFAPETAEGKERREERKSA